MTGLFDLFVAEAHELVEQAGDALLGLGRMPAGSPAAREALDTAFRAFHTLKGSAAMFELRAMASALHAVEDLLAAARRQSEEDGASPALDLALDALDAVARWLLAIEASGGAMPAAAEAEATELAAALRAAIPGTAPQRRAAAPHEAVEAPPDWLRQLDAAEREAVLAEAGKAPAAVIVAITYDPDPDCFLRGEDPLALLRRVPGLAVLRLLPRAPWPAPDAMDPFGCNLLIRAVAVAPLAEVVAALRPAAGQVQLAPVPPDGFQHATGADARAMAAEMLREQLALLGTAAPEAERAGRGGAALRAAAAALRAAGAEEAATGLEAHLDRPAAEQSAAIAAALAGLERAAPAPRPGMAGPDEVADARAQATAPRAMRVDPSRVDRLIGLAEEAVLAQARLQEVARQAEALLRDSHPALARALFREAGQTRRLARDWHDAAARLRLQPLDTLFRRFPRQLRQMAREMGKPAELHIFGGVTEADRDVLERLSEPLIHLLRNALDHGVELPEERRRRGKPAEAALCLRGGTEGGMLVIELEDDGRGIDTVALRRRAVARGLLDEAAAAALSEDAAAELVFTAGLSTAATLSEVSGRGIGMDIVRRTVEALGGSVGLSTRPGQGTVMRLRLPLSLSLTGILTVRAGGQVLGLPLDAVDGTLRLPRACIGTPDGGGSAFAYAGAVVPLLRLDEILDLPAADAAARDFACVVLAGAANGTPVGLEVDAFGERLDTVLRPAGELLAGIGGYAGTTLLGDGRVLLVLDPASLLR